MFIDRAVVEVRSGKVAMALLPFYVKNMSLMVDLPVVMEDVEPQFISGQIAK